MDLNSKLNSLNSQDIIKNEITNVTMDNGVISQSVMYFEKSIVDMLDNYNRSNGLQQNNLIRRATVENNATVSQSSILVSNRSSLTDVEYFVSDNPDNGQDAINEVKNLNITDNSLVYQDRLELNSAILKKSTLSRTNSIKDTNMGNESNLYQYYTQILNQAEVKGSKLSGKSFVDDVYINNSNVAQSATNIQ